MSTTVSGITASRWVSRFPRFRGPRWMPARSKSSLGVVLSLQIDPLKPDRLTVSLSADEAWRLCRDLARAAADAERES